MGNFKKILIFCNTNNAVCLLWSSLLFDILFHQGRSNCLLCLSVFGDRVVDAVLQTFINKLFVATQINFIQIIQISTK